MNLPFYQSYDPLGNPLLSTLVAALAICFLLMAVSVFKLRLPVAAGIGLGIAGCVAILVYHLPLKMAAASVLYGFAYGFLPIGWVILNIFFLYRLVDAKGLIQTLQQSLTSISADQRIQLLLVAICLGSFFEGVAGYGTPVAVCALILMGLGFPALEASVLVLIANTTPVVFGALGTGVLALQQVTSLGLEPLSKAIAWQVFPLGILIPLWLVWAFAGFKRMLAVWPAVLVVGLGYSLTQFAIAFFHGPWLPAVGGAFASLGGMLLLLRFWKPRENLVPYPLVSKATIDAERKQVGKAWLPWGVLSLTVFIWGIPQVKSFLDRFTLTIPVPYLDQLSIRMPPIVSNATPAVAVFQLNWLSATGTVIFLTAILCGFLLGHSIKGILQAYWAAIRQVFWTLVTICLLVAMGFITRYAGIDATLGLALAVSGALYPLFGTLLGWLGVVSTGSAAASIILFGGLQRITATRLGINPVTMAAANASGAVAGKVISPQSVSIAVSATGQQGMEGKIIRKVFIPSIVMVLFIALGVMIQVYFFP